MASDYNQRAVDILGTIVDAMKEQTSTAALELRVLRMSDESLSPVTAVYRSDDEGEPQIWIEIE